MTVRIIQGDARRLPLDDESVDLIVTSPPYFALRSYTDGGEHYDRQIGAEPTPQEYIDNLIDCTREWMRVLKPDGSLWVNLGDSYYSGKGAPGRTTIDAKSEARTVRRAGGNPLDGPSFGVGRKSLIGLPWRYALRCIDDLGLILRAEIIWAKPNSLPESVQDRVRRSHEQWFHLVKQPRYYSAIDHIRTPHANPGKNYGPGGAGANAMRARNTSINGGAAPYDGPNPLGALPGSVWEIPTEPLQVPAHLGIDHFACVDTETEILTRRGWLRHDQLRGDDQVAGYDLDGGITRWTGLHGVHRYDYDGDLVSVEARGLSMRLTPNHRTLAHRHAGRHRLRQPLEVIRADELAKEHSIPRAVQWSDDGREKSIGAGLAALLGWVAAEGWYSADRRRVYLSQSATANPAHVEQIGSLLDRLGDTPLRTERDRTRGRAVWRDVQWRLGPALSAEVSRIMPDKLLPMSLADLPLGEARALLDAFVDGDGHRRADGRVSVFQKLRHNLDVLQAMAARCGYNTTLSRDDSNNRWVLYLNPPRPARLRRSDGTSLVSREHYRGTVWCVTTGTGTFVARRRGTVFVTGNSFPMEWPRRIILGWSPSGICTTCGEGRRPVSTSVRLDGDGGSVGEVSAAQAKARRSSTVRAMSRGIAEHAVTGEVCGCPDTSAPTRPAVVLDPFGGTGTTALVAHALGRDGISGDMSADYCRLATWRTTDPGQLAKAMGVPKPPKELDGQASALDLLTELDGGAA